MSSESSYAYAFNRTRQGFLAHDVRVADTHWTRLRGLLGTRKNDFSPGKALWIVPCHGVHTFAMSFAIDVVYLDDHFNVVHLEENVKPWRITPVRTDAATVLELPQRTIWSTQTCIGDQIEIEFTNKETEELSEAGARNKGSGNG